MPDLWALGSLGTNRTDKGPSQGPNLTGFQFPGWVGQTYRQRQSGFLVTKMDIIKICYQLHLFLNCSLLDKSRLFGSHFSNLDRCDVAISQFDLVRPPSHTVEVGEVKLWEGGLLGVHEVDLPHPPLPQLSSCRDIEDVSSDPHNILCCAQRIFHWQAEDRYYGN